MNCVDEKCLIYSNIRFSICWLGLNYYGKKHALSHLSCELALENILVAYVPWEGCNFEDESFISDCLVCEDIYTSFHRRKYKMATLHTTGGHFYDTSMRFLLCQIQQIPMCPILHLLFLVPTIGSWAGLRY